MDVKQNELEHAITESMKQVAEMHSVEIVEPILQETVLLESGLDSLGFATLVATLEMELGFDPFSESETAFYPRTFGEFVTFYFENQPSQ